MSPTNEKQFLEERSQVIGGSDWGAVFNMDWGCKRRLKYEKTGVKPDFLEVKKPEFERGHYVEPVVAQLYADKTRRTVETIGFVRHPSISIMGVHMDRVVTALEKPGKGYLEIKVVNYRTFRKFLKEGLHGGYILQMQGGLAVTDYKWGSFAVLCLDPWDFKYFDVERDEEIIYTLKKEALKFQADIEQGLEYSRLEAGDKRCFTCPYRRTCQGDALAGLIPPTDADANILDLPELLPVAAEIQEIDTMTDDLKKVRDDLNAQIDQMIGDADGAKYPGGKTLKIRPEGRKGWDMKALWALWEKATPRLKQMLGPYCNDGKPGKAPAPHLRHYWTGE